MNLKKVYKNKIQVTEISETWIFYYFLLENQ